MDSIKVLICDDMPAICKRYQSILNKDPQLTVVGVAHNGYDVVLKSVLLKPDVVLMDIEMETKTAGITATKELVRQIPTIKIIMLTVYENSELICQAYHAGVIDYIMKTASPKDLIQGVKDAYSMNSPIRPNVAKYLRTEFKHVKNVQESLFTTIANFILLSPTEREILSALYDGKSRSEICEERCIEMSTLKTQLHSILRKMKKSSVKEVLDTLESLDFIRLLKKPD